MGCKVGVGDWVMVAVEVCVWVEVMVGVRVWVGSGVEEITNVWVVSPETSG